MSYLDQLLGVDLNHKVCKTIIQRNITVNKCICSSYSFLFYYSYVIARCKYSLLFCTLSLNSLHVFDLQRGNPFQFRTSQREEINLRNQRENGKLIYFIILIFYGNAVSFLFRLLTNCNRLCRKLGNGKVEWVIGGILHALFYMR